MGWDVTTLTGENAVVEATLSVRGPTILQFATHGFSLDRPTADAEGWDNPLIRSMLILAGANKWEASHSDFYRVGREVLTKDEALARGVSRDQMEHARFEVADGILTAYQAAGMDLHGTELVNLTACETGMGDVTPEGVAGLRQSFLIAGARSLTISMWQIPVAETTEQMHDFYVRWLAPMQGVPPISRYAAFRAAQMAALSRARRTYGSGHPLYWGGVVFGGDPGDLPDLRTNQQFTTH
jgi:CHAT domain-containing protein